MLQTSPLFVWVACLAAIVAIVMPGCTAECRPGSIRYGDTCIPTPADAGVDASTAPNVTDEEAGSGGRASGGRGGRSSGGAGGRTNEGGGGKAGADEPLAGRAADGGEGAAGESSVAGGAGAAGVDAPAAGSDGAAGVDAVGGAAAGAGADAPAAGGVGGEEPASGGMPGEEPPVAGNGDEVCPGGGTPSTEVCDAARVDEDCDGERNEGCECVEDQSETCSGSSEGLCEPGTRRCSGGRWSECNGVVGPSNEVCDGRDNNCDGEVDDNATGCGPRERCSNGDCVCVPQCDKSCGADGCGEMCPDRCTGNTQCNPSTEQCECAPQCRLGQQCGSNGCNGTCGSGCSNNQTCSSEGRCVDNCGNGVEDSGEECDDANNNNTDMCINCKDAFCGDGFVAEGLEECEPFGGADWSGLCQQVTCTRTAYIRCAGSSTNCPPSEQCQVPTGNADQSFCGTTNCGACPVPSAAYRAECNFGVCTLLCNSGTCPADMSCVPAAFIDTMTGETRTENVCVPS